MHVVLSDTDEIVHTPKSWNYFYNRVDLESNDVTTERTSRWSNQIYKWELRNMNPELLQVFPEWNLGLEIAFWVFIALLPIIIGLIIWSFVRYSKIKKEIDLSDDQKSKKGKKNDS